MPSSSNQPMLMVLHCDMDLFYDIVLEFGCSKFKWLKKNPRCVMLSHYINGRLRKVDGLILPTTVKNPIDDIEKTCRNTSICSFFYKLEAKSTNFHPKLTNPSPFVESTKSSSEPKYDINTTQNIYTRISKKVV
jgi:hypothetical protein